MLYKANEWIVPASGKTLFLPPQAFCTEVKTMALFLLYWVQQSKEHWPVAFLIFQKGCTKPPVGKANMGWLENGLDPQVGHLQATDAGLSISLGP